jgi:uncharacterized protein involved in type VI secretion and phage assembly
VPETSDHKPKTSISLSKSEQFTWGKKDDPDPDPPVAKLLWGKYRGTVVSNRDLPPKGRLLVNVPGILTANWAEPCMPFVGMLAGTFIRPAIGANVWVEFERGDPDKPIWTGGWWGDGDLASIAEEYGAEPEIPVITIETNTEGISISPTPLSVGGEPGNVNLMAGSGATTIALSSDGVSITASQVTINATTFSVVTPDGTFTVG